MNHLGRRPRRRHLNSPATRAQCTSVHDNAPVALPRLTTSDYPEDARNRLGRAVTRAREAAGWARRRDLADHAGVSLRSIVKLEAGDEGVGRRVLEAVGRTLPTWTEDTPYNVLGGEPAPATKSDESAVEPPSVPSLTDEDKIRLRVLKDALSAEDLKVEIIFELVAHLLQSAGMAVTPENFQYFLSELERQRPIQDSEVRKETEQVTPGEHS